MCEAAAPAAVRGCARALEALRRLTDLGIAVLILHRTAKRDAAGS